MDILISSAPSDENKKNTPRKERNKSHDIIAAARQANSGHEIKAGSLDTFAISGFPKRPAKLFW